MNKRSQQSKDKTKEKKPITITPDDLIGNQSETNMTSSRANQKANRSFYDWLLMMSLAHHTLRDKRFAVIKASL